MRDFIMCLISTFIGIVMTCIYLYVIGYLII